MGRCRPEGEVPESRTWPGTYSRRLPACERRAIGMSAASHRAAGSHARRGQAAHVPPKGRSVADIAQV
eukprot:scaffold50045_cov57-Phaeocystis_antarctica.AAC.2